MSVNPDDNYKIIVFQHNTWRLDGILFAGARDPDDPRHVFDELLRWHYRRCVFANMGGAGEPIFEHDYPPGSDIMGELREAPCGQEQPELMLADRLQGFTVE